MTGGWLYVQPEQKEAVALQQGRFDVGVGRIHNRGDRLEWQLTVPQSGKYRIWLRYGNNMRAFGVDNMGGRTGLRLGINTWTIADLPDTGSFSTFRWQPVATVSLEEGTHTLVWKNLVNKYA